MSIFLPNDAEMEDWYESVSSIPMSWSDISSLESDYMKRVHPSDFHVIRKQVQAKCFWKVLKPNWSLLAYHLYAQDKLFQNRSHKPGEVMQEVVYSGPGWEAVWYRWQQHKFYLDSTRSVDPEITFLDEQVVIAQLHDAIDGEGNEISDKFARLEEQPCNDIRSKRQKRANEWPYVIGLMCVWVLPRCLLHRHQFYEDVDSVE